MCGVRCACAGAIAAGVGVAGLIGAPPITLYMGSESHGSVAKALGIVGLGHVSVSSCFFLVLFNSGNLLSPVHELNPCHAVPCLAAGVQGLVGGASMSPFSLPTGRAPSVRVPLKDARHHAHRPS